MRRLGALPIILSLAITPFMIKKAFHNKSDTDDTENDIVTGQSGSFNVLSYNVKGLPDMITGSKGSNNNKLISPKLNDYDIVNVQENFAYNDNLNSQLDFKYRTKFSGNVPLGDGLMTFSRFPIKIFDRKAWKDSYGFVFDGADEMTLKGFTFSSVQLKKGIYLDVYNLHADAFDDDKSIEARNSNMKQLAEYINGISDGKAVLVFGDFNSLYTIEGDNLEELLLNKCYLKDAWIENQMNGEIPKKGQHLSEIELGQKGEVFDKILYKSGKNLEINAKSFEILFNEFTDDKEKQLSDHFPVTADIDFQIIDDILTSDIFGRTAEKGFSFVGKIESKYPKAVIIQGDEKIKKVGFIYYEQGEIILGSKSGNSANRTYYFNQREYITSITVSARYSSNKKHINYIYLKTNLNKEISVGTYNALLKKQTFTAPDNYGIAGFIGYYNDENISGLGCVYQKIK